MIHIPSFTELNVMLFYNHVNKLRIYFMILLQEIIEGTRGKRLLTASIH